jgi:hypothetical protein
MTSVIVIITFIVKAVVGLIHSLEKFVGRSVLNVGTAVHLIGLCVIFVFGIRLSSFHRMLHFNGRLDFIN